MKKNLNYTAPETEILEVRIEAGFLNSTLGKSSSTVESADYHNDVAW